MLRIVHSELLKMKHTFSIKLVVVAPLFTVLLGYLLSEKSVQFCAYNWWYTMILPITVSLWSANTIQCEKKTGMQNMLCLPLRVETLWFGKVAAVSFLLLLSNLFMWLITSAFGIYTTMYISIIDGLIGCLLLFVTYLWQIPFVMFLTGKIGFIGSIILSFLGNILLSSFFAEKSWFMYIPYAIPCRIVCPFFKMSPNGLPLSSESDLLNNTPIVSTIFVCLIFTLFVLFLSPKQLKKGSRQYV